MMERMFADIPEDMDKREGSLLYTCLSAAAVQMSMLSLELEHLYDNAYADSASGEYLERLCALLGVERRSGTRCVVKVEADAPLAVGEVFFGGDYEYEIISVCDGYYLAQCSSEGSDANSYTGEITPKNDIENLSSVRITSVTAEGKDAEEDEDLRKRFFDRARRPICAGNLNYYRSALSGLSGTGGVKILPSETECGGVRVIITDTNYAVPSEELVSYVQQTVDPPETSGQGYGIAPIGHRVTVEGAVKRDITVKIRLTTNGSGAATVINAAGYAIGKRVEEENLKWSEQKAMVVRASMFEEIFLGERYVEDVEVLDINGEANRLILGENEIIGKVTVKNEQ